MIKQLLTRTRWSVVRKYRDTSVGQTFSTLDKTFRIEMVDAPVASDSESSVFRYHQDGHTFFVKRYHDTKGLRSWMGRSRLRGEWHSYQLFRRLNIPAAQLVAYGEERFLTHAGRGALITEAIPDTEDLARLAKTGDDRFQNPEWVRKIIEQVAIFARKMHDDGFAHNDLKWRNILVNNNLEKPGVFLIDCPAGQHWFGPFLKYRIIKDLACLDKLGKYHLSRTQRLRFFLKYREASKLSSQDKTMIRKILTFFEGRE